MFIEILFKMLLFKGGVLIYAENCMFHFYLIFTILCHFIYIYMQLCAKKLLFVCLLDIFVYIYYIYVESGPDSLWS